MIICWQRDFQEIPLKNDEISLNNDDFRRWSVGDRC